MDVDADNENQQSQSSTKSAPAASPSKTPVKSTMKSKAQSLGGVTGSPKAKSTPPPPVTLNTEQVCHEIQLGAEAIGQKILVMSVIRFVEMCQETCCLM